ncbi:MAG: DUF2490 domain-containing protein [Reichenbachiella sp.]|uniref:DUF2490 domain-containing protein n=1 Tax=Reichenbachiella sp. TaxID=2184521 RepID=UPI003264D205
MKKKTIFRFIIITILISHTGKAQINESELGAWYMYFFNTTFKESSWGVQGDIQYRNWNLAGDLEQLLIRGGITYKPQNANIKLTLGYGNITTGTYGSDQSTSAESRIYQEALYPVRIGQRFHLNHRFRFEQRFVEGQNFRTRFRYNLFLNIPLNNADMEDRTIYLSLYNELFINGQRDIGNENQVELFDRNRFYAAIGYIIRKGLRVQLGAMKQTTNNWSKDQLQISFHHQF